MNDLIKSRQFWVGVFGAIVTLIVYFTAKYAAAGLEDIQMVIGVLTPIILALIAAYTINDIAKANNENSVRIEEMRLASLQLQVRLAAMDAGVEKHSSKDAAKHG